ncbi:MAG: hypothetical protein AB1726_08000 [Planctomycetota bacterium]
MGSGWWGSCASSAWCYPWVGLLCGPVPAALLWPASTPDPDRGGLLLMGALLGLFVGLVEWGRIRRAESRGGNGSAGADL